MKAFYSLIALGLLVCRAVPAQGIISTVAGGSGFLDNTPAVQARLDGPQGLAIDQQGNSYFGDGRRIRRLDAVTGIISTVAGNGDRSSFKDGIATQVSLEAPGYLAFDARGNLLFLDANRLMKLDLQAGILTTMVGRYASTTPQFGFMSGLATDRAGNIFITDDYDGKIYRIDAGTGTVSRFAGLGSAANSGTPEGDGGPATQSLLGRPGVITLDPSGNVFFAEQYWLRKIDAKTGIITTIMPISFYGASGDGGPVIKAALGNASALATDSKGNLYIADGPRIRKIDWSTGIIVTVAGSGQKQYAGDGTSALTANLSYVTSINIDTRGNLWLGDMGNRRLLVVSADTGLIRTVAGTSANGDGGPALGAVLVSPSGIAVDAQSNLYIAAGGIRKVDHITGNISTIAQGQGQIALDSAGNLFFGNQDRIQRVDAVSGNVTTVAGGNGTGFGGDGGPATKAQISPTAVALDQSGNLYIADYWNYRIRRVDAKTGIISTIAGNGGVQTFSGVTGAATQIPIGAPTSIAVAPGGDVYWTTAGRVLRLDSAAALSVVAGNGGCVYAGDGGPATLASLCQPYGLSFDEAGNLFVGEGRCSCVRRVDAGSGLIQTVAGTGTAGVSEDSIPATQAALTIGAIAFAKNTLYVIDSLISQLNGRIRAVTPAVPPTMPQPPKISEIVNAVDFRARYSPGAILSVMGNYLSSPVPASGELGADGRFTNTLAGGQVVFKGVPGPLLYTSAGQINTIVPYSLSPENIVVQVKTAAGTDTLNNFAVEQTSLSLFDGLVLNPDGTMNSVANPAPKGATLIMYGTGMGQTNPAGVDGVIMRGPDFPRPVIQFSGIVRNGILQYNADVPYLGPLPGFVAGAVQANVRIPDAVPPGESTLILALASDVGFRGPTAVEKIYMLSDPPVLTGVSPSSPIPQTVGLGNSLTLSGTKLNKIVAVNFFFADKPVKMQQQMFMGCTETTCTVSVYFAGQAGDYAVELVNAANQVSNRLTFTVQPFPNPTITDVGRLYSSAPLVATKGTQIVAVNGTSFQTPLSTDIFYNGNRISTLSSSGSSVQIFGVTPTLFHMFFDFQERSGLYGIEVVGPGESRSARFNFTVAAP